MALTDMSLVTFLVQKLIEQNIRFHLHPGLNVTTSAASPTATGASPTNLITVYLHHLTEEAAYKNAAPHGGGRVPVRETPLALALYYVVNAHHDTAHPATDALVQQRLLGYVAKTLHDYPVLTGQTRIDPVATQPTLFELATLGPSDDRIELIVRPMKPEESSQFWGNADVPRATLFVEARVVMLAPAQPAAFAPPVLGLGLFAESGGGPVLFGSRSAVSFALPRAFGSGARQRVEMSPARVSVFSAGVAPSAPHAGNDRLVLSAAGLAGARRILRLRAGDRLVRVNLDDPAANPALAIELGASSLALSLRDVVVDESGESRALVPGIHGVAVVVERERDTAAGRARIASASNELAVALAPQLDSVVLEPDGETVRATLLGAYLARPPARERDLDIQVSVGGEPFEDIRTRTPGSANPPLEPGTYDRTVDGAGRANTLMLRLTEPLRTSLASGAPLPLCLLINGVEAPPAWIEV